MVRSFMRVLRNFLPCICVFALLGCSPIVNNELAGLPSAEQYADARRMRAGDGGTTTSDAAGDAGDAAESVLDSAAQASPDAAFPPGNPGPNGDAGPLDDGAVAISVADAGVQLCVGVSHACGLLPSGRVTCWGNDDENDDGETTLQSAVPDTRFVDLSCGAYHTCGITREGSVLCVGRNRDGQRDPPAAVSARRDYVQVTAGDVQTCARKSDGTIDCWGGSGALPWAKPPPDAFRTIEAGTGFACGIRSLDGTLLCWGDNAHGQTQAPTGANMKSVSAGDGQGCAIDASDHVSCWGGKSAEQLPVLTSARAVSVGGDYYNNRVCASLTDGTATCWRDDQVTMQPGPYRSIAVGAQADCFLPRDGNLTCNVAVDALGETELIRTRAPEPYPPPDELLPPE